MNSTRRWLALALTLAGLAGCTPPAPPSGTPQPNAGARRGSSARASSAVAHQLVEHGATLLDVRSDAEFAQGHLDGARHIPVNQLAARIAELPTDEPVVVYCASGGRSAAAAEILAGHGLEAHDLGGMSNW